MMDWECCKDAEKINAHVDMSTGKTKKGMERYY
jgi:hypothetical protein